MAEKGPTSVRVSPRKVTPRKTVENISPSVNSTPSKKARAASLDETIAVDHSAGYESPPSARPVLPAHPSLVRAAMGASHPVISRNLDARIHGSTWTKVKAEEDHLDRHELFLLADGEKKVEVEPVTQIANAAVFKFNKEDHTLANMLRDKLFRLEHVTFAAYKVPHPLFATFELRVHTDGEISPKEAVVQACQELVQELQQLDQEFTKEFELRKITGQGPDAA